MKIKELIEHLNEFPDQNADVRFEYPSGDFWKTRIAKEITNLNMKKVKKDDYHSKFIIAPPDERGEIALILS